jgi:type VI secretion system protein ImpM
VTSPAAGVVRLGLIGKLPAHADFVRRGSLPGSFCTPWDAWLEAGIAAARAAIGEARWAGVWDAAPAWRFVLPAGACGPGAAAGVLLPSRDAVGRCWPLTLAAVRSDGGEVWPAPWFAALEGIGRAGLLQGQDADALSALLPSPSEPAAPAADPLSAFWASVEENRLASAIAAEGGGDAAAAAPGDPAGEAGVAPGWWTADGADGTPGLVWPLAALPPAEAFVLLLETMA